MTGLPAGCVTVAEASRLLRCGREEVLRLADLGRLPRLVHKIPGGRVLLFRAADVLRLAAEDGA